MEQMEFYGIVAEDLIDYLDALDLPEGLSLAELPVLVRDSSNALTMLKKMELHYEAPDKLPTLILS